MDVARAGAEEIAAAICQEIAGRPPAYLPIEPGGAEHAARIIGQLL